MKKYGIVILFGSGETLDTGRKIQRNLLLSLPEKQHVAVLETPAGFQPNASVVAQELAETFEESLKEFVENVSIIPARKKGTEYSPDDETVIAPLHHASYIVLGPGSPTYAVKQLQNSKTLDLLKTRWEQGATLVLSSAAAIASGAYVLPVYEIYKAGFDLYWEKGLDLFENAGFSLSIITHWNNTDGGEKLDTSHCFMGEKRFAMLYKLLPKDKPVLCIDEHTAVILFIADDIFQVQGKGQMTLLLQESQITFYHGKTYSISAMLRGVIKEVQYKKKSITKPFEKKKYVDKISESIRALLEKRKKAKLERDFTKADSIRKEVEALGYIIEDKDGEQKISKR